jgi:hypothetical protein
LNDQSVALIVEAFTGMVGVCGGLLQCGECRDHFARDQIVSYAEVLKRALRLRSPQHRARDVNFTQTIGLFPDFHRLLR